MKIKTQILITLLVITLMSCGFEPNKKCNTSSKLTISQSGIILLNSYNMLSGRIQLSECSTPNHYNTVSLAMPAAYFGNKGAKGLVTFSSFMIPNNFSYRTIWGVQPGCFSYYGACAPDTIICDHHRNGHNDVFECRFIDTAIYKAFTGNKNDWNSLLKIAAISPSLVAGFEDFEIEPINGYIASTEANNYTNKFSCKGIKTKIKLKTGEIKGCYLINNYDRTGTLIWKK